MDRKKTFSIGKSSYSYTRSEVADTSALRQAHSHDFYEILYVIDGRGSFLCEGREYPLGKRSLFVIPPAKAHSVDIDADVSYERCVTHFFESELFNESRELLSAFKLGDGIFYISDMNLQAVSRQFEQLEFSDSLSDVTRATHFRLALSELVLLIASASCDATLRDEGELGERLARYLNENIDKDVSLDALAKRFFVSKYYLCRAFKTYAGVSVHGYVNQKRVMYAKSLIESGETASGAAYRVGFGDYSAFYRAYMKIVGKSPTS